MIKQTFQNYLLICVFSYSYNQRNTYPAVMKMSIEKV